MKTLQAKDLRPVEVPVLIGLNRELTMWILNNLAFATAKRCGNSLQVADSAEVAAVSKISPLESVIALKNKDLFWRSMAQARALRRDGEKRPGETLKHTRIGITGYSL